jgi:hypothetical protein
MLFAQDCNTYIEENEYDEKYGHGLGRNDTMPVLITYPKISAWGMLPSNIISQLSDFRIELLQATRDLIGVHDIDGLPAATETATRFYVLYGYRALEIAERMRKIYRLGGYKSVVPTNWAFELKVRYRKQHQGYLRRFLNGIWPFRVQRYFKKYWRMLKNIVCLR